MNFLCFLPLSFKVTKNLALIMWKMTLKQIPAKYQGYLHYKMVIIYIIICIPILENCMMLLRYCTLVIHAESSKDNVEPYCFNGSHILNTKYSNTHYRWFRITFSPKFTLNVFLNAFTDIFCICSWNFLMQ